MEWKRKKVTELGKNIIKKLYGDENFNLKGKYIEINRTDFFKS